MVDYVAVVDCGTVVNPNLATVQTQGGVAQGIGMALWEDIQYNAGEGDFEVGVGLGDDLLAIEHHLQYRHAQPVGALIPVPL